MTKNNKGKKVLIKGNGPQPFEAYLVEECDAKFIVRNKTGNIEMHYPKKDYSYTVLEDK